MEIVKAILLCAFFFGVIYLFRLQRNKGSFFTGITIGFCIYYYLVPIVALFVPNDLKYRYISTIVNSDFYSFFFVVFLQFILYLSIFLAFSYTNRKCDRVVSVHKKVRLITIGNAVLLIGGICTLVYTLAFGGIIIALSLAGTVRSHIDSAINHIGYWQGILIEPAGLVTLAPFCFLLVGKKNRITIVKAVIAILLSIVFFLVKAGRAPLLIFLVAIFFPIMKSRFKHPWLILFFVAIVALPLLDVLDTIFDGKTVSSFSYNYSSYVDQFSYPFANSLNVFDIISKFGIRFGQDFFTSILGLIPGVNFDSTWMITSEYYNGTNWAIYGSVPMDLFTFCMIEFHVFGIIILGSIIGIIARVVDDSLSTLRDGSYGASSIETAILMSVAWRVSTADFQSLVRSVFLMGLCIIVVTVTYKRRNKRRKKDFAALLKSYYWTNNY